MVREYHQPKKMRLPKFKGLNGTIAVSTWLRAVQTETRRQERTLGIRWERDEVYFEMASHLEGEALRWYGNIMSSVIDETDETLARLLRGRYGEQRSDRKWWQASTTGSRCGASRSWSTQQRCGRSLPTEALARSG
jgi:hypothetical protein